MGSIRTHFAIAGIFLSKIYLHLRSSTCRNSQRMFSLYHLLLFLQKCGNLELMMLQGFRSKTFGHFRVLGCSLLAFKILAAVFVVYISFRGREPITLDVSESSMSPKSCRLRALHASRNVWTIIKNKDNSTEAT